MIRRNLIPSMPAVPAASVPAQGGESPNPIDSSGRE
jgi:hypothetical protein